MLWNTNGLFSEAAGQEIVKSYCLSLLADVIIPFSRQESDCCVYPASSTCSLGFCLLVYLKGSWFVCSSVCFRVCFVFMCMSVLLARDVDSVSGDSRGCQTIWNLRYRELWGALSCWESNPHHLQEQPALQTLSLQTLQPFKPSFTKRLNYTRKLNTF